MGNKIVVRSIVIIIIYSLVISLGLVLGCQQSLLSQDEKPTVPLQDEKINIDKQNIKKHVQELASKKYGGRRAGTSGEAEAALYLAGQLKQMGVQPLGEKNTYFQTFAIPETGLRPNGNRTEFYITDTNTKAELLADNVLGILENSPKSKQYILLSAHYDHLGIWQNKLYPGSNDNASGVAAVLEIINVLKEARDLPYGIIVAFWSGEEMGLLGSNYFINNPTVDLSKVKLAINLDSIGTGANDNFILWSEGSSEIIERFKLLKMEKAHLSFQSDGVHTSDHKALAKAGIPAISILAGNWLDKNHSTLDTPIILNYDKITDLAQEVADLLSRSEIVKITQG